MTRHQVFSQHSYQQLQCDTYFLYQVCFGGTNSEQASLTGDICFDILPAIVDESTPVYLGLFNEVMSSAILRFFATQAGEGPVLPLGIDETLLVTMS